MISRDEDLHPGDQAHGQLHDGAMAHQLRSFRGPQSRHGCVSSLNDWPDCRDHADGHGDAKLFAMLILRRQPTRFHSDTVAAQQALPYAAARPTRLPGEGAQDPTPHSCRCRG